MCSYFQIYWKEAPWSAMMILVISDVLLNKFEPVNDIIYEISCLYTFQAKVRFL